MKEPKVITSLDELTCDSCIWCRTTDDDGAFCANHPPCDDSRETYFDRNPKSFCNAGAWIVYDKANKTHYVHDRERCIYEILEPPDRNWTEEREFLRAEMDELSVRLIFLESKVADLVRKFDA